MTDHRSFPLWWLALAAALVPLLTIHITFAVSVMEGHVELCIPYWDSCTSISRTGRYGTSYFIFKGTMLPAAVLGILFWWLNSRWLRQLGIHSRGVAWLPWLGLIASLSLAAYTLALGHAGDGFNLIRRTGVVLYFALTFICELLVSGGLRNHPQWAQTGRKLTKLCMFTLGIGILSVIIDGVAPEFHNRRDDAFEWVLAALVNAHALWLALLWRKSRFRARLWAG
jgi:Frag1/DRAM/Sfk1 family protein